MNTADIIVAAVLALLIGAAVAAIIVRRRKGKGCSGDCAHCQRHRDNCR